MFILSMLSWTCFVIRSGRWQKKNIRHIASQIQQSLFGLTIMQTSNSCIPFLIFLRSYRCYVHPILLNHFIYFFRSCFLGTVSVKVNMMPKEKLPNLPPLLERHSFGCIILVYLYVLAFLSLSPSPVSSEIFVREIYINVQLYSLYLYV